MRALSRRLLPAAVGLVLAAPLTVAHATNGYFAIGYGMKNRSMGGAAIADPKDSLAATANPAGMAFVGSRLDVGGRFFIPKRQVAAQGELGLSADSRGNGDSTSNLFFIPNMGFNFDYTRKLSIGMDMIGNGGMSTRYNQNFLFGNSTLGVSLMQAMILPTVAYKVNDQNAIGISPIIAIQSFRAYGLTAFASSAVSTDPAHVTNNGNDYTYGGGVRIGWMGRFLNGHLSLGATYATKVYMTRFRKYSGLFADHGSFDIPSNYGVGIAIKPVDSFRVAIDVTRILYADVPAVGDPHPHVGPLLTAIGNAGGLGATDGLGFGWNNMTIYKIGFAYHYSPKWQFRAGFNYGKSPIPNNQLLLNTLAPGLVERHYTVGITYAPSPSSEINWSYTYVPRKTQICAAPGCTTMLTSTKGQFVGAQMWQNSMGLSYALKF